MISWIFKKNEYPTDWHIHAANILSSLIFLLMQAFLDTVWHYALVINAPICGAMIGGMIANAMGIMPSTNNRAYLLVTLLYASLGMYVAITSTYAEIISHAIFIAMLTVCGGLMGGIISSIVNPIPDIDKATANQWRTYCILVIGTTTGALYMACQIAL